MISNLETLRTQFDCPERNLVSAIIIRAWADLDNVDPHLQKDAYNWVHSRYDGLPQKWSFVWCCEVLGINADDLKAMTLEAPSTHKIFKLSFNRYKRKKD